MIIRLYTGEDGQSHFEDIALPWADDERGRGQTPLQGAATGLEFARLPSGYASAWHTASRHAYAIILSGQMECTIGGWDRAATGARGYYARRRFHRERSF
jgi:hypothetical protein